MTAPPLDLFELIERAPFGSSPAILIVEEEAVAAMERALLLAAEGYTIAGQARCCADALAAASRADYALVDKDLKDGHCLVRALSEAGVGVILAGEADAPVALVRRAEQLRRLEEV